MTMKAWGFISKEDYPNAFEELGKFTSDFRVMAVEYPRNIMVGTLLEGEFLFACTLELIQPKHWKRRQNEAIDAARTFAVHGTKIPAFFTFPSKMQAIAQNVETRIRVPILRPRMPDYLHTAVLHTLELLST
jgi:hypothetical protein